jgi:hypothetical protein
MHYLILCRWQLDRRCSPQPVLAGTLFYGLPVVLADAPRVFRFRPGPATCPRHSWLYQKSIKHARTI